MAGSLAGRTDNRSGQRVSPWARSAYSLRCVTERVVVTGGSGKLGTAVVAELVAHGYDVFNIDQAAPAAPAACPWTRVDLTEYGQVVEALTAIDDRHAGIDAIVHLAAIP